jgi:hypothetical protein
VLVEALAHPLGQHLGQRRAVGLGERLPALRLGRLDPGQQVGQEQGVLAVVKGGVALGIQPAVAAEVLADRGFEVVFLVQAGHHRLRLS